MWKLSARFVASNIAPSKLEGLSALNNTFRVVSEFISDHIIIFDEDLDA